MSELMPLMMTRTCLRKRTAEVGVGERAGEEAEEGKARGKARAGAKVKGQQLPSPAQKALQMNMKM